MKAFYLVLLCLAGITIHSAAFNLPEDSLTSHITPANIKQDLDLADQMFLEGKLTSSRAIYRKYIKDLDLTRKYRLGSTLIFSDCNREDFKLGYELLNEVLKSGNKQAEAYVGWTLFNGMGVERDTVKGLDLIKAGAAAQDPWGYYFYALYYKYKKDYTNAFDYLKKAAKRDHDAAMCLIGVMYQYGYLGEPDYGKAQEWYKKATRYNNGSAWGYWARLLYRGGRGIERNQTLAFQNFAKAAEIGDPERVGDLGLGNCYRMGQGVTQNLNAALFHYRRAAENRQSKGYCNLGYMYEKGIGTEQDIDSAMRNYVRAAELNDTWAWYRLAKILSEGILVPQNDTMAAKAIIAGAELEDVDCEIELALYYKAGRGVVQSLDKCREILTGPRLKDLPAAIYELALIEDSLEHRELAIGLLKQCSDKGYDEAMFMLARIYKRNLKDSGDRKLYTEWLEKAIKGGNTDAMFLLGFENYYGINRAKDIYTGNSLITYAARRGNSTARDLISLYPKDFGDGKTIYVQAIAEEGDYRDYATDYEPPFSGISLTAMDGNPDAQFLMGKKYLKGVGVKKNMELAIQWFQQAAAQGYPPAYFQLGYMYETGEGLPQSYADAMTWYELAAEKDVSMAINNIGSMYYNGKGVPVDKNKAAEYYKKAAEQGVALAKNNLGYYYLYDCDTLKGNAPKGLALMTEAAEAGDELAQHNLSRMYANGRFVKKDKEKSEFWLMKAARQNKVGAMLDLALLLCERNPADTNARNIFIHLARMGNARALVNLYIRYKIKNTLTREQEEHILADLLKDPYSLNDEDKIVLMRFYRYGIGTPKDFNKAITLGLQFAGPASHYDIDANLGDLYIAKDTPDNKSALKWYRSAADKGGVSAASVVGQNYYTGKDIPVDDSLAAHYTRFAAENDYTFAMRLLGIMYSEGRGVVQDMPQAISWLEKAAARNDFGAMEVLAGFYRKGEKLPKDQEKGMSWLEKAANQGDLWAINELARTYRIGEGVKTDLRKHLYWLEKAVAKGDGIAMNNLGECYYQGQGVKKDYAKAIYYYQQAIDHQEAWGKFSLSTLYLNGHGVEKSEAKAKELLKGACEEHVEEACAELKKLDRQPE
jgi:TPR repeat protein